MSWGLRWLSFGLGLWSLAAVVRALNLAGRLAEGGGSDPARVWTEALVWALPAIVAGLAAAAAVSLPSSDMDEYLARNVRMGVMVAVFAVGLAWALVIYAAYLQGLGGA